MNVNVGDGNVRNLMSMSRAEASGANGTEEDFI